MKRAFTLIAALLLVPALVCPLAAQAPEPKPEAHAGNGSQDVGKSKNLSPADSYGRLPLSFEANEGQTDPRVKFLSRGAGQTLFLTSTEAVLAYGKRAAVQMRLVGANRNAQVSGEDRLPGISSYFIGNDPANWRSDIPTFGRVHYRQIYSGIDLVYYGNPRELEYDFVVAPGANPSQIELAVGGASKISIDAYGNAVVRRSDGEFRLLKPRFYQVLGRQKIEITGKYAVKGRELRFDVGPYDSDYPLTIDPVLSYSTFLGGSGTEAGQSIAVDAAGNAYVTGSTTSPNFPGISSSSFQSTESGSSVIVTKINPTGSAVLFSTYLGGSGQGLGIAVDSSENVYVSGVTFVGGFPLSANPILSTFSSPNTGFVTKLNPTGSAIFYSTYLQTGQGEAIAVDPAGNAYVTGWNQDLGRFPCCATSYFGSSGTNDVYVTKINPTGSALVYSAYVGGTSSQRGWGIAADSSGNAYVTGDTSSSNFPITANSYQTTFGGALDAFALKLNPTGTSLLYSTFIGGAGSDQNHAIAIDSSGNAYMAGNSAGIAVAMKLDATGHTLLYSTPLSTFHCCDTANGIAVDASGQAYITGAVGPTLITANPIQATWAGGTYDSFMSQLDASGNIIFATFLGGDLNDQGQGIAVDSSGAAYLTGSTASNSNELIPFPTTLGVIQSANTGGGKIFVTKFAGSSVATGTTTTLTTALNPTVFGQQVSFTVNVTPNSSSALTPSGNVTINDGGTPLGTVTLASGTAIFNTSALSVGSHSITAVYAGDSNFATSTSSASTLLVNQGATAASASAFPNPGIVGQSVTLSASVTPVAPAAGTPTGTVTFFDGVTSLGTGTLSGGQATLATPSLASGTHSITVTYAGDSNFLGSTSSAVSVAMQQATTTALIVVPNPANAGQLVTLSATVAATPGVPTGETVTFLDGAAVLGTGTISAGGTATFTTVSLATGNHNLSASYPGDANFAPSTSGTVPLIVVLPPVVITDNETVTVTDTESFPDVFDPETVNVMDAAWITPLINVAAPVISFSAGGLGFSTVTAGQTGTQPLTVSDIGQAPLVISSAVLSPGSVFSISQISCSNGSSSLPTTLPVGGACILMISYLAPSGPASSDVLTFTDNAGLSNLPSVPTGSSYTQSIPLTGSGANTPPPPPPPAVVPIMDNETVTVTDTESFPDVSDAETVHVTDQASIQVISPTTTSINAPGVAFGTPAAATVSVSSAFAAVSGNVMLSVDGGAATTLPLSSGSAVFSLGLLAAGTHSLSASFPAQNNFFASSATGSIFVSQAPSIASANAATFVAGTAGSFTVTTTGIPFPISMITSGTLPTRVTFVDNGNGTATLAGTPPLGATGVFPLTITASNGVGVPAVQNFTLAVNQPPSITSGNTTTFTEGASVSFTVTAAGFPIPAISESPVLPAGLTLVDNGDGTASLAGTPATGTQGSYAITIAAINGVSPDASQSFTLNINLGPAITSGSSTTFTEQMPGSFLVTTLAFPAPVLTETGMLPSGVTFRDNHDGTATLAGTPAVGTSHTYPITISASNTVGSPTVQAFTLIVNPTTSITSGSTTTFTVGSAGFFSVTTSGSPVPALTFTGTLPAGVTFTDNGNGTATLTGTPAAGTANNYPLIITVTNGVGSPAIQNFTLAVNQGAAILTGNATTFTVGVSTSFTVMTSGFPTPTIVEAPPLPAGVTFVDNGDGTGTLSGTPAANTGGTYPITFTANNSVDLPALQTFTLTINQGPAITSSNMVTFTEQTFGFFTVTASGNPVPALSEVGALPNGLSFVDEGNGTALISGGLAAGSSGQYGFTITAANGVLPNATQTFTLTVVPLVGITSANSATFTVGTSGSFLVTTTGIPIPTLTIAGALPSGVAFTPNSDGTAILSGIPAAGTEGSYPVTFTAKNSAATSTQSFTLSVVLSTTPGTPTITSANHTTFWKGVQNRFTVTSTGFPVPALTVPPANIPAGVTFQDNHDGTATVSGFPTVGIGSFAFTITATGAGGKQFAVAQRFTLGAGLLPPVPKFTSASQTVFHVGVYSSFTVAAGPVVTSITRQGASLPTGVTYTDNHNGTATLGGTPQDPTGAIGSGGLFLQYTFTASNNTAANYSTTQTFTLLVLPAASSAPAFTSANHASFWRGQQNRFTVTTTGFPIPVLTVPPAKVPVGVSFQDNHDGTATISGFPNFFGPFGFTITATGAGGKQFAAVQRFTAGAGNVPRVPKFTSVSQTVFRVGVFSSFTVAAGPLVTSITRQGPGLPAGVTYTDNHDGTATLSGTPQDPTGTIGSSGLLLPYTFTASNTQVSSTYQTTQTFTLLVLP